MFIEITKFILYSGLIVLISKYILVTTLRRFAENLEIEPKLIGNITGYATSIPELLTISISSINGLFATSIFNILSSNIINFLQYSISIIINKNKKALNNKAIKIDIFLVLITILIPLFLIWKDIELNLGIVPIFGFLYLLFYYLNNNSHKLYLNKEQKELEKQIIDEEERIKGNTRKTVLYISILICTGFLLYVIGELLGDTLNNLCNYFKVPEIIIGVLLGLITSIPELITFFESQKYYKEQKKNKELGVVEATNNLLTSNITNLFIIQSIGIGVYTIFY